MIKDLPINTNGKLTGDARKNLAIIIENEFRNKESLYHQVKEQERNRIIEAYRKSVGYADMRKAYDKACAKMETYKREILKTQEAFSTVGLDSGGNIASGYWRDDQGITHSVVEVKELKEKLAVIEKNAPSENLKSKLISRLWLATTIGEANEIMREILGNGVIPATDIKAITFQG